MLDRMRRHKGWLKWSLALVIFAFVFLYVPGLMDQTGGAGCPATSSREWATRRSRWPTPADIHPPASGVPPGVRRGDSEEVLRSLGIDRQILQQMIDGHAALAEAERLGLQVSDAEVRGAHPDAAGVPDRRAVHRRGELPPTAAAATPPLTPGQFEEEIRSEILVDRLQAAVTGWMRVSDAEIADEHRRRNERVRVDVVAFRAADFRDEVEANDDDVSLLFSEEAATTRSPRSGGCGSCWWTRQPSSTASS